MILKSSERLEVIVHQQILVLSISINIFIHTTILNTSFKAHSWSHEIKLLYLFDLDCKHPL